MKFGMRMLKNAICVKIDSTIVILYMIMSVTSYLQFPHFFYLIWLNLVYKKYTQCRLAEPSFAQNVCSEVHTLTLILLTWRIWRAPNNASRRKMGFNSAFKDLNQRHKCNTVHIFLNFQYDSVYTPSGTCAKKRNRFGGRQFRQRKAANSATFRNRATL